MIIRVALFLTLVAVFYHYCREDNTSNQFRGPNDINMIEVPQEISPVFMENANTVAYDFADSIYFLSSEYSLLEASPIRIQNTSLKNN